MSALLTLVLPMPPNLGNARQHWRVKHDERTRYFNECAMRVCAKLIPEPPETTPERVRISSRMFLGARMDVDNAMHRHKWILDWLQRCAYIRNDNAKHLEWAGFPEQIVKRDGNYRVEITLTPIVK